MSPPTVTGLTAVVAMAGCAFVTEAEASSSSVAPQSATDPVQPGTLPSTNTVLWSGLAATSAAADVYEHVNSQCSPGSTTSLSFASPELCGALAPRYACGA